tara:strand:- start:34 stop:1305 length:1272 start_codon:yes stop_codon:yes gene_type:complete
MQIDSTICIVGLGYVGLPLAVEFSKHFEVIGYDLNKKRINELKECYDRTKEVEKNELLSSKNLNFSYEEKNLAKANFYIVTVPTPIDNVNKPDFSAIKNASNTIAKYLKKGDIVVFESTVYPGATREICIPILEKVSGLKLNSEFGVGYSPERINPGDKSRRISNIIKITSGSSPEVAEKVDHIYKRIIRAGTHKTSSIEVAEAAKVIENTQRDINIALMNELSIIFKKLDISTNDVLEAANTKWNFLNFKPGLVGGHCIGVDPYYLTERALQVNYKPELILAGRRINDDMARYVVNNFLKIALRRNVFQDSKKVLLMGITFKENCPDIRNSKSIEIAKLLIEYGLDLEIYDPISDVDENFEFIKYKINTIEDNNNYCGIIISIPHDIFKIINLKKINKNGLEKCVVFDLKNLYKNTNESWRL